MAAETTAPKQKARPEKPDEAKYRTALAEAEKEHAEVQARLAAVKAKIDIAKPQGKDSPASQKRDALRAELAEIRKQQQAFKQSRGSIQEKIAALDSNLKSRIAEQKTARSRVPFKNVEEIDYEIKRLESQVDSGTMKLVDEKKNLANISSLKKQRKGFASFDDAQKGIDDIKKQISELKKSADNVEVKALSEKYTNIQKELDELRAEQDEAYKGLNSLRDERTKIHDEAQEKWKKIHEIKDNHRAARDAYRKYEDELWKARRERQKAEREAYEKEKRRKIAEKKLEEASKPAFIEEIATAEGLIRYLDPAALPAAEVAETSKFAAQAQRHVDDSGLKGMKVLKKDEVDFFVGGGGKKSKKGKKHNGHNAHNANTPNSQVLNLNLGVLEDFNTVNVEPPTNQAEVPAVVEKLKEKIEKWKTEQKQKTDENIARAKKEIEKLEQQAREESAAREAKAESDKKVNGTHDNSKKPASLNAGVNGKVSPQAELAQETDAIADVTEELEKAAVEDKSE